MLRIFGEREDEVCRLLKLCTLVDFNSLQSSEKNLVYVVVSISSADFLEARSAIDELILMRVNL